jgi:hypothetical protein
MFALTHLRSHIVTGFELTLEPERPPRRIDQRCLRRPLRQGRGLQPGCAILPGWLLGLFRRPGGQSAVEGAAVVLRVPVVAVVVVAGAVVVVGAERVPPPPPVPPPVCASASPKDPATNAADKVDTMMNLLMGNLLPSSLSPALLNSR